MKVDNLVYVIGCLMVLGLFFYLFGRWGFQLGLVWAGLFILLPYLVIRELDLDDDEKLFTSFFIGFGFLSTLAYWPSFWIGSIKITLIIMVVIILIGVGMYNLLKKKKVI